MNTKNKDFNEILKEKGYKVTAQRKQVLDVIKENAGKHLTAEEIYELVKKKAPDIGIATVYRTISLLEKMNLIFRVDFGSGSVKYEWDRMDMPHRHHHLICLECGEIIEVEEDLLDDTEERISLKHNFLIKDHCVKFYGYCLKCRNKIKE